MLRQLAVLLLVGGTVFSHALQLPDGRTKICMVAGAIVPEMFVPPGAINGLAGFTTFNPLPLLIKWDPQRLSQLTQQGSALGGQHGGNLVIEFLAFHECAHARLGTPNEVVANCEAFRQMNALGELMPGDAQLLAVFHANLGPLPPQYGGSGVAFWAATKACILQFPAPPSPLDMVPE